MFQALPANTGLIYVGTSDMSISTGVGILGVIPAPSSATTGPFASLSFSEPLAPAGLNLADLWLDTSHSGDSVYISGTVQ